VEILKQLRHNLDINKSFSWWADWQGWQRQLFQFWQLGLRSQVLRVAVLYSITVLILLAIGTLLFEIYIMW
jgi:hypothetical protein